jgi:hypothetical protein
MTLVLGEGEDHNTLGPAARQMVIDLIGAIFPLRVPADADFTRGPVALTRIDERAGAYWLGDNYSRDTGPWATFPGKDALPRTSFLPTADLAARWKAAVSPLPADVQVGDGVCPTCYPQPPGEPPATPPAAPVTSSGGGCALGGTGAGLAPALLALLALRRRRR